MDISANIELSPIEITLVDDGAKDDVDNFVAMGGMRFPIVKVSNTVINQSDTRQVSLKMGYRNPVPVLNLVINDSLAQFRNTDYIDNQTEIRCWIGCSTSDETPINLTFKITDCQTKNNNVILQCALDLPTDKITIVHGTVEQMLSDFAEKTGIGVFCNFDFLQENVEKSFVEVSPSEFMQQFAEHLHIDNWYVNHKYQYCLIDIEQLIAEHKQKSCSILFETYKDIEPMPVIYANNNDRVTQFSFATFGYDIIKASETVENAESVIFDKSFVPDLTKTNQVVENEFVSYPPKLQYDSLYFESSFDPYKCVGNTLDIEVYTQQGVPKRLTIDEANNGDRKPMGQQLIADISGVYMLTDVDYMYSNGHIDTWASFMRPSANGI